jgi:hypothetical protein
MVRYTTTSPAHRDVPTRAQTTGSAAEPTDALTAARAEALFASDVPMRSTLTRDEFRAAVRDALLRHHGVRGCAAEVAAAYGDCPETAVPRMRWARQVVRSMYGEPVRPVPAASRRRPGSAARELTLA